MSQDDALGRIRELTEEQRDKIFGSEAEYIRQVRSPSWQTIRRLGKGTLKGGVEHKQVASIEKTLGLTRWTLKYLFEGDRERLLKLPNDTAVVEHLDRLTARPPKRGAGRRNPGA